VNLKLNKLCLPEVINMAERPNSIQTTNGVDLEEDDMFEQDLEDMFKDGPPNFNDYHSPMSGGSSNSGDLGTGMSRKPPSTLQIGHNSSPGKCFKKAYPVNCVHFVK
jgi:hypothetical protein